jgi:DnaJ-domain-containing protein 1
VARVVLFILVAIAGFLALGLILGVLLLLLQMGVLMLPAYCVTVAVMLATLFVYTKRRMQQLVRTNMQFGTAISARFDQHSLKWVWHLDDTRILPLLDPGMGRALMALVGGAAALFALNRLNAQQVFNTQVWWFWGKVTSVPEQVSLVFGTFILGVVVVMVLVKLSPELAFRKLLARQAASFITPDDDIRLVEVNGLYAAVMQLFAQIAQAVKTSGDLALTQELQAIHVGLTSSNLTALVDRRQWREFQQVMVGMMQDLERLRVQVSAGSYAYSGYASYGESEEEKAFRILGVPATATMEEIKAAYRSGALRCHPDRNGGGDDSRMQELNAAYAFLGQKRR